MSDRWATDVHKRDDTGWISFGAFLIIASVIYLITPNLGREIEALLRDFRFVEVFHNFWWFVPSTSHPVLYRAAEWFCYAFGLVQVGILGLRFMMGSSVRGKADTFAGVIFWLGLGYAFGLLSRGTLSWISFLGVFVVLVGVSIVVQSLVLLLAPRR